jgi:hypothetical protein
VTHIDRDAFTRVFKATGNIEKARLAAGYSPKQARKGKTDLPKDLRAVVNDNGALGRFVKTEQLTVLPTVPILTSHAPVVRFRPGESGNPLGAGAEGYKRTKSIREGFQRIIQRDGADLFCQQVAHDALNSTKPAERLAAFQEIADRLEGRAVQAHVIQSQIDERTARILTELADRLFSDQI